MSEPFDVVCFGLLTPHRVATVEEYPKADSGAVISSFFDLDCVDSTIASLALRRLGCRVGLVSNDVGNDADGRALLGRLKRAGIHTTANLLEDVSTPYAITIADSKGTRTWFSFLSNSVESIATADLGLFQRASMLYVDVYAIIWQASVRAIDCATELGIPIVVNLDDYDDLADGICRRLRQGVSVIQKSAAGPSIEQARETAQTLYDGSSASLCVLTLGGHGVVYTNPSGTFHLPAHDVQVASTAGAGAVFSAGMVYGLGQSWSDDETVAFANALSALFCSASNGISSSSATEVMDWAASRDLQLTRLY